MKFVLTREQEGRGEEGEAEEKSKGKWDEPDKKKLNDLLLLVLKTFLSNNKSSRRICFWYEMRVAPHRPAAIFFFFNEFF